MNWFRNWRRRSPRGPVAVRPTFRPGVEVLEDRRLMAGMTFTVSNLGDNGGVNPAPGAGTGTLRQAIVDNNANAPPAGSTNTIVFTVAGVITIDAGSNNVLPTITNAVVINGWSAPNGGEGKAPVVEIDGSAMGNFFPSTQPGYNGLNITANNCTIEGLAIGGFYTNSNAQLGQNNGTGIFIFSNTNTNAQGSFNVVQGCYLGLNLGGTADINEGDGITIQGGDSNTVGGTTAGAANVLSENDEAGVKLGGYHNSSTNITGPFTANNMIEGNLIGTNPAGTTHEGNDNGVEVFQAVDNLIQNNTIAGNVLNGIYLSGTPDYQATTATGFALGNTISGNAIGVNLSNNTAIENDVNGIDLYEDANDTVISGNNILDSGSNGLQIFFCAYNSVTGNFFGISQNQAVASGQNGDGILVSGGGNGGNLISGNTIARSVEYGIEISGTNNNLIQSNYIGVDSAGDTQTPSEYDYENFQYGLTLDNGASGNLVGGVEVESNGTIIGLGNVISNNSSSKNALGGVHIIGGSDNNILQGNFIGTDPEGDSLPNDQDGIDINGSNGNTVGGPSTGDANIIAYNGGYGIDIYNGSSNNLIEGNLVGAVPKPSVSSTSTPTTTPAYTSFTGTDAAANTKAAANGNVQIYSDGTGSGNTFEYNSASVTTDPPGLDIAPGDTNVHNQVIKAPASNVPVANGGSTFLVLTQPNGTVVAQLAPFGTSWTGGMSVAYGDVNGDGVPDIIVGAGPGGGPQVVVYDSTTLKVINSFYAFNPSFTGGVWVATADLTGNGVDDIICGAGPGGGPQVTIFDSTKLNQELANGLLPTTAIMASFYAFNPSFSGGVRVASDDINGDGSWDLVVSAGPGGGPQVLAIDGSRLAQLQPNGEIASSAILGSFYAFASSFTGGVFVTAGDPFGNGYADIITGAGAGGGPQVTIWDSKDFSMVDSFYAFGASFTGGVRVGMADFTRNGHLSLLTAAGTGSGQVNIFDARTLSLLDSYDAGSTGNTIAGTRS